MVLFQTSFFSCKKNYIDRTNHFGIIHIQENSFSEKVHNWSQVVKLFLDLRKNSNKNWNSDQYKHPTVKMRETLFYVYLIFGRAPKS